MALMRDGTVCCWGVLNQGGDRGTSVIMRGPSGITAISAAGASNLSGYCAAASASGEVFAWAGTAHSYMPPAVQMRVRGRPRALAADSTGPWGPLFVVTDDGTLWSWGTNNQGQLGRGGPSRFMDVGAVGGLPAIADVVYGWCWAVALDRYGGVWEWGTLRVRPPDEPRDAAEDAVARARPARPAPKTSRCARTLAASRAINFCILFNHTGRR